MDSALLEYSYTLVTVLFLAGVLRFTHAKPKTRKKHMVIWGLFGFAFNLYSLSWLYTVYPLAWIPEGYMQLLGISILHVTSAFIAGLAFTITGLAFHTRIPSSYKPLVFAGLLATSEVLRSLFLTTLFSGNGGEVGLHWAAGTIGNALSTTPFIEYAYFGGPYMLTFIIGCIVYICLSKTNFKEYQHYLVLIILGLLAIHFLIPVRGPKTPIRISVITTDFKTPPTSQNITPVFREQWKTVNAMTLSLASSSPSIVVYPEDTRYTEQFTQENKQALVSSLGKVLLVDGTTQKFKEGTSNYSVFYSSETQKYIGRGKSFLFPFNEYVPVLFESIFRIFVHGTVLDDYIRLHTYIPQSFIGTFTYDGMRIGTLICSEILSFDVIKRLEVTSPDVVIFQAHLNVFHDNPWFVMHLRSFTKIAAAQLRTPLIGTANSAPSYVISPYGSILFSTDTGFSTRTYTFYKDSVKALSK